MSWCRWDAGSDVYVYESVKGGFICCACRLYLLLEEPERDYTCDTAEGMVEHLRAHQKAGDQVPENVWEMGQDEEALEHERWTALQRKRTEGE